MRGCLRLRWRGLVGQPAAHDGGRPNAAEPQADREPIRRLIRDCLEGGGGEVSAQTRAAELAKFYRESSTARRILFLDVLARDFDVSTELVARACAAFVEAGEDGARAVLLPGLRLALEPPRLKVLRLLNRLPGGIKQLIDMRADLMEYEATDPALPALERELRGLLTNWLDIGFLQIRRLTWDSPAALLEKLIRYEAVHEIRGWQDLKNRLDADRRCFAIFHPYLPDEPLTFVEIALVRGIAGNIQALLDEAAPVENPAAADTAIFYSISNCQKGLAGIRFGHFLIMQVVERLSAQLPNLKNFVTLSPIPGFADWLDANPDKWSPAMMTARDRRLIQALPRPLSNFSLQRLLAVPRWWNDEALARALRGPLMRLCAYYLMSGRTGEHKRTLDPVAHFHLSNGARIERLNWLADLSPKGLRQSHGLMVNYRYDRSEIEENHEAYVGEGKIAASARIRAMDARVRKLAETVASARSHHTV
jgi:malonyl-CoA decarboxylase